MVPSVNDNSEVMPHRSVQSINDVVDTGIVRFTGVTDTCIACIDGVFSHSLYSIIHSPPPFTSFQV
jgi:hypothetical protein